MRSLAFLVWVPIAVVACSSDDDSDGRDCTLLACLQGVEVAFTETQAGAYALEIVIDGATSTCATTLPLPANETASPCTSPDVTLTLSGSALPAAQQSIGGLRIARADAKSVTVRVARDGAAVRNATFAPSYIVRPSPNGPGCEPAQCVNATFTLP